MNRTRATRQLRPSPEVDVSLFLETNALLRQPATKSRDRATLFCPSAELLAIIRIFEARKIEFSFNSVSFQSFHSKYSKKDVFCLNHRSTA